MASDGERARVAQAVPWAVGIAACCTAALLGIWLLTGRSSHRRHADLPEEEQPFPQGSVEAPEAPEEAKKSSSEDRRTWIECAIPLPEGHGPLFFARARAHPFFAEYDRKLRFMSPEGKEAVGWVPPNIGGRTMINLYWYPASEKEGPYVRFVERWWVYVADVRQRTLNLMGELRGELYICEIPSGRKVGGFSSGWGQSDGEEEPTYHVGGNEGHKVTGMLAQGQGEYIGRLDGRTEPVRFVSRDDAPEEEIERR